MLVTSIFTNLIANNVPGSSGINLEADMAEEIIHTRDRVTGECWYMLSKITAFRWHVNRIENLLLSIYAEHPDQNDPYKGIYDSIWEALKGCEDAIIEAKKKHGPLRPPDSEVRKDCGCWKDEDCGTGWWCNKDTGLCEPDPRDPQLRN
jgi:hypothetical protein